MVDGQTRASRGSAVGDGEQAPLSAPLRGRLNTKKRWAAAALCGLVLGVAPLVSTAQTMSLEQARSFSLGLAGTTTHWRADCVGTTGCDRNDSGWRLTGAWQFAPQGALELVATEQGRVKAEALSTAGLKTSELRVRGMGVGVAWLMPLSPEWLFAARLGALANRARFQETASLDGASSQTSHTRTDPMLGLGLSWRFSPSVSVDGRLDWTSTRLGPPSQSLIGGGRTDGHQWGLGVTGYF